MVKKENVDESQGFWTPAQAAFLARLHEQAFVICTGDAQQPAGAAANVLDQFLLGHAVTRGAGTHSPALRFATPLTALTEAASYVASQDSTFTAWATAPPTRAHFAEARAHDFNHDLGTSPNC